MAKTYYKLSENSPILMELFPLLLYLQTFHILFWTISPDELYRCEFHSLTLNIFTPIQHQGLTNLTFGVSFLFLRNIKFRNYFCICLSLNKSYIRFKLYTCFRLHPFDSLNRSLEHHYVQKFSGYLQINFFIVSPQTFLCLLIAI